MRTFRSTVAIVSAALVIAIAPVVADASSTPSDRPGRTNADVTVTLVTGDTVVLPSGDLDRARVEPGRGRDDVSFHVQRAGDDLRVTPSDAQPLLADGRLDERLFNVTWLTEHGYDDADRDDIPLIAKQSDDTASQGLLGNVLSAAGALVSDVLGTLGVSISTVHKDDAAHFWDTVTSTSHDLGGIEKLWLDGVAKPMLDESAAQVGAPTAWDMGYDGEGVTVAVLDTGVYRDHPDLSNQVDVYKNFTAERGDPQGHGTHVTSILAGAGSASHGKYTGVAPGASVVFAKVCTMEQCPESALLSAMEWATVEQQARVVNISLGDEDRPGVDPLEDAVNTLTKKTDALFVAAAGNGAEQGVRVTSPASADAALAVGAVDDDHKVAPFSSKGPRVGDGALKPDIVAPGVNITAAKAPKSNLGRTVGDKYQQASGTSMATPHVSGVAAILAQRHPHWGASELKSALMASADPIPGVKAIAQGAGEVNAPSALQQRVLTSPAAVDFGLQTWPHEDDEVGTRSVTYRNMSDEPITLDLELTMADGSDAAVFELAETTLQIPAHAEATTKLSADTSQPVADKRHAGVITASDGTGETVTPFAVEKEAESYDVNLRHYDLAGEQSKRFHTTIYNHDDPGQRIVLDSQSDDRPGANLRLPKGTYTVSSRLCVSGCDAGSGDKDEALIVYPVLEVDDDQTISLDAREAQPLAVTGPSDGSDLRWAEAGYNMQLDGAVPVEDKFVGNSFDGWYLAHLGPEQPAGEMEGKVAGVWADAERDPETAHVRAWFTPGRVPAGFAAQVSEDDSAEVTMDVAATRDDEVARGTWHAVGEGPGFVSLPLPPTSLPDEISTSLNTEGVQWSAGLTFEPVFRNLWSEPTTFEPGESYREVWNRGVFGPGRVSPIAGPWATSPSAVREGNVIHIRDLPLYSDGAGHNGRGDPAVLDGTTTLYRNGSLVGDSEWPGAGKFTVPSSASNYRLDVSMEHEADEAPHSSDIDVSWTFRSEESASVHELLLPVVRFAPELSDENRLQATGEVTIPVTVDAAPEAPYVTSLRVDVSFDDGETWQEGPVLETDGGSTIAVKHPEGAEFVSLRAEAEVADGTAVEQTIIRAYAVS